VSEATPPPWEKPEDWWRDGPAPPDELAALMAQWEAPPDSVPMFTSVEHVTDAQGRVFGPVIQARVDEHGHLVLTIRRNTTPEERDRLVLCVLMRLDREALWIRVRRSGGTFAPTVETWRKGEES
jgi:hypothetical protein